MRANTARTGIAHLAAAGLAYALIGTLQQPIFIGSGAAVVPAGPKIIPIATESSIHYYTTGIRMTSRMWRRSRGIGSAAKRGKVANRHKAKR